MVPKERMEKLKTRAVVGLIFMNLFLIGAFFNLLAISDNGGKMPVYTDNPFETSPRHFIFNNASEVNHFYLTDIMRASFVKQGFEVYFSIGDVIIYATGIMFFIFCLVNLISDVRYLYSRMRRDTGERNE